MEQVEEVTHSSTLTPDLVKKMLELNRQYDSFATSLLHRSSQVYDTPTTTCEEAVIQLNANTSTVIVMDGILVSPEDGALIAKALAENTSVKRLRMTECAIGDQVAISIAEALKVNSTLEDLQLGTNAIHNAGLAALGAALRENTSIRQFAARYNDFDDVGAAAFFAELRKTPSLCASISHLSANNTCRVSNLEVLSLCNNDVGDESVKQLAKLLTENALGKLPEGHRGYPKLSQVNFFNNHVTDEGVKSLLPALELKSMNVQLIFSHSCSTEEGSAAVDLALKEHQTLQQVAPFQIVRVAQR